MNSKTQQVVRAFLYTDLEWYPAVIKCKEGYNVVCVREKRGLKEYGCILGTFKLEGYATKAASAALETRSKMLALAYP